MKRNLLFLAAALLCGPVSLHARTYTLEQCKALALENNNKMKNGLLDVQIAAQTRKEAFTRFSRPSARRGWRSRRVTTC